MDPQDNVPAPAANAQARPAATVKLPPFWPRSPAAWFRTADAQFNIKGVTEDMDKYFLILSALNEEQVDLVRNIVEEEPAADSYNRLRTALIATHALSPYQMVDMLVNSEPLGSRKPTELLAAMNKLRPANDAAFFAYHFLQRLPREVRILLAHDDYTDMRALAEKADQLAAMHTPQHQVVAAATEEEEDVAAVVNRQQKKKKKKVFKIQPGGSSGNGGSGGKQTSLCRFHAKFGDKAYNCEEGCSWPEN